MRIVCLTHVPFEGPGTIGAWAAARGHSFEVLPLYDSDAQHPGEFDMLVVMGGPMSVHDEDEHPWLVAERRLIRVAIDDGKSVLGVCLGAQIVAEVLGGEVRRCSGPEIGWYPVRLTEEGLASSILGVLPSEFDAIHWHGDTFEIPAGAVHLAESSHTSSQAFEYDAGRVVGLQFHLELDRNSLELLIESAVKDLEEPGEWVSSAEKMLAGTERLVRSREWMFALMDSMAARRTGGARPSR